MGGPLEALGGISNKFSALVQGFGTGDTKFDPKKLLFDQDGKVIHGHVPPNQGSTFGYGFTSSGAQGLAAFDPNS